jgi:hypothetical protein
MFRQNPGRILLSLVFWCCTAAAQSGAQGTSSGALPATSVRAIFEKNNLLGTFAWDCSKQPDRNSNWYFVNRALDADHVQRDFMVGPTTRAWATIIDQATELGPNEIGWSSIRDGQRSVGVWRLDGNRVRQWRATANGKDIISDGKLVASGKELPWLNACDRNPGQAGALEPPRKEAVAAAEAPQVQSSTNRIAALSSLPTAEQRRQLADRLVAGVLTHSTPPLEVQERDTAVLLLVTEPDRFVRESLWQLLANSPRHEPAVALARQVVVDPAGFPRWSAFRYLAAVDPQTAEKLSEGALAQADADLLYVVADFLMQTDPNRGLALMIDVIPQVQDLNLFESVSLALALKGGERELDELNRRDRMAGGDTAFGTAADMLAAELARKTASPKN